LKDKKNKKKRSKSKVFGAMRDNRKNTIKMVRKSISKMLTNYGLSPRDPRIVESESQESRDSDDFNHP
jgi:hypothetical protein